MSVLISGVLTDGAGLPMSGYHIILKARQNTSAVVMRTVATVVTEPTGEYAFEAQTGRYDVYLRSCIEREYCVGDISVYDDSRSGTLNDFLTALDEGDLKPDVVKRFEEMVAQAQQSAEAAAESERQAGQHVADAQQIKSDCETLADNVQQNAEAVAEDKKHVAQLSSQVEDTAEEVRQDAEAARKAASDAEQARDEIDTALSATLKTANHLSEIAAEGEEAQQESRDNLGLKSAATMEPQSDTYDRTEGRLAIPGALGFGEIFHINDRISFDTRAEFDSWIRGAKPGRYLVHANHSIVIPKVLFSGILEIIWASNLEGTTNGVKRIYFFYGVNGEVYYARGTSGVPAWELWRRTDKELIDFLSGTVYSGGLNASPEAGGIVQAAFRYQDKPGGYTLKRGDALSGSLLKPYIITVDESGEQTLHIKEEHTFPGYYWSLTSYPWLKTSDYILGIFIRYR
ncbi:prophage tail fiber N-terminal domain-containing protein [Escherichia coli]|nr:prophage tail fiber N-terminal domain-containing protein [Escherichia coli]